MTDMNQQAVGMRRLPGTGQQHADYIADDAGFHPVDYQGAVPSEASAPPKDTHTDEVPAMLTPNEYVMPADVVLKKGTDFFDKLRDTTRGVNTKGKGMRKEQPDMSGGAMHAAGVLGQSSVVPKPDEDPSFWARLGQGMRLAGQIAGGTAPVAGMQAAMNSSPAKVSMDAPPLPRGVSEIAQGLRGEAPARPGLAPAPAPVQAPPPVQPGADRIDLSGGNYITRGKNQSDESVARAKSYMTSSPAAGGAGAGALQGSSVGAPAVEQPPMQTPVQVPAYQGADYSGAINQLIEQSAVEGSPNSFDSRIAAKHQREAAQHTLAAIGGMRAADQQTGLGYAKEAANAQTAQKLADQQAASQFRAQNMELQGRGYATDAVRYAAGMRNQTELGRLLYENERKFDEHVDKLASGLSDKYFGGLDKKGGMSGSLADEDEDLPAADFRAQLESAGVPPELSSRLKIRVDPESRHITVNGVTGTPEGMLTKIATQFHR